MKKRQRSVGGSLFRRHAEATILLCITNFHFAIVLRATRPQQMPRAGRPIRFALHFWCRWRAGINEGRQGTNEALRPAMTARWDNAPCLAPGDSSQGVGRNARYALDDLEWRAVVMGVPGLERHGEEGLLLLIAPGDHGHLFRTGAGVDAAQQRQIVFRGRAQGDGRRRRHSLRNNHRGCGNQRIWQGVLPYCEVTNRHIGEMGDGAGTFGTELRVVPTLGSMAERLWRWGTGVVVPRPSIIPHPSSLIHHPSSIIYHLPSAIIPRPALRVTPTTQGLQKGCHMKCSGVWCWQQPLPPLQHVSPS